MSGDRGLSAVFRRGEFRALWAADVLSVLGDQLTRVALAVLVFARTDSAAWAAGTYALTFLPAIVGGVALSGVADRFRRREVLLACDLLRAGPVALMAVPGLPLPVMCGLVVVVVLLGAPHAAARGALLPAVLPGDLYERGLAVIQISAQTSQLAGFAAGGVLVAALGAGPALLLDAATFLLAGVIVRIGLVDRPAAGGSGATRSHWRDAVAGIADIAADPRRRALIALAWTIGCFVVPEALAVPYAAQVGAGTATAGLLMAAGPLGSILGAWLFVRFVPAERRPGLIGPVAVAAGVPLLLMALRPELPVVIVLWAASGLLSTAYLLQAQASFVRATPEAVRGRAIGVAASGIIASQGVAVLGGGLLADALDPATAIVAAGAAGIALGLVGAVAWRRACGEGRGQRGAIAVTTTAAEPRPRPDG
jgi:Major Facilitator Superfamily